MDIKMPPRRACVAILPCETLMSAKQAIKDKLQGSVATHLRNGGVERFIVKSASEKIKSVNIRQSYRQKRDYLVHFLRLLAVCWPSEKVHDTITFLLVTLPNIYRF